jgi:putative transcriptional regulator
MRLAAPVLKPPGASAPAYHPAEELLLDYASGASSAAEAMMIATHLACCAICRHTVRIALQAGGALFDAIAPKRLPPDMLNRTLTAIDTARTVVQPPGLPRLPAMLDGFLARPDWRRLPGGFRMRRISCDDHAGADHIWLFDVPPGMRLPPHRHSGDEWTVTLRGVFVDRDTQYGPGDFACLSDGEVHRPMVGARERCVSLIMVTQAPRYTTLLGKLSSLFVRL